jgi:hypothetical protein
VFCIMCIMRPNWVTLNKVELFNTVLLLTGSLYGPTHEFNTVLLLTGSL